MGSEDVETGLKRMGRPSAIRSLSPVGVSGTGGGGRPVVE